MKLTVKQAAARAGISAQLVYLWCEERRLMHYRCCRDVDRLQLLGLGDLTGHQLVERLLDLGRRVPAVLALPRRQGPLGVIAETVLDAL